MVPLQKREQETDDANHETSDDRNNRQDADPSGNALALHNEERHHDKGKNSQESDAYNDSQDPWEPLALLYLILSPRNWTGQ